MRHGRQWDEEGRHRAREAWEAWCENEAARCDALAARATVGQARADTLAVHQRILATRGYRYYDRRTMQTPELAAARSTERAAKVQETQMWIRAHEAWGEAADRLSHFYDWVAGKE